MRTGKHLRQLAKQLFRLCLAGGVFDENRVRLVVSRLANSRLRDRFALLSQLRRLIAQECTRRSALIESAVPLPPDVLANVQSGLIQTYGRGLQFSYEQRPDLIGGIRVRVGNDVYDGSVQARLTALENRL